MGNFLILSSAENTRATCDFVVIGIPETSLERYQDETIFNDFIERHLKHQYGKIYTSYAIIYVGDIRLFKSYNILVEVIKRDKKTNKVEFRDYTKTKEAQLASKSNVIIAEDSITSWNTVRSSLGARTPHTPCFAVILEVVTNK